MHLCLIIFIISGEGPCAFDNCFRVVISYFVTRCIKIHSLFILFVKLIFILMHQVFSLIIVLKIHLMGFAIVDQKKVFISERLTLCMWTCCLILRFVIFLISMVVTCLSIHLVVYLFSTNLVNFISVCSNYLLLLLACLVPKFCRWSFKLYAAPISIRL